MENTVLIVDDDENVSKMLCKVMRSNALEPDVAFSGEEALKKLQENKYVLMLLDINMNGMSGFEVLSILRKNGNRIPVMIVSGRKEDFDTLHGLDIGADEYITKPFNPVTLGAKAKALIRRSNGEFSEKNGIAVGPFRYDLSSLRLYKNGVEIPLSAKENGMIKLFLDNTGRVFSKELLYDLVWGTTGARDDNAVMVYINHLRQKIEDDPAHPNYIRTVRGIGYHFVV